MLVELVVTTLILLPAQITVSEPSAWASEVLQGKRAFAEGRYADSAIAYRAAIAKAEESDRSASSIAPLLESLSGALRVGGNIAEAQSVLERLLPLTAELHGATGNEYANILGEYANVQRLQGSLEEALASIKESIEIRGRSGLSEALARDATVAGSIAKDMADIKQATNYFTQALSFWAALPSSGLQILAPLDALAVIYRDEGAYGDAERYCRWALRLREAALGPKHSDLIATLDSLAYALFGQQKFTEAESVYLRLLSLWESSAGLDHPMVALTLDKMVEFYSAQKFYDKARPLAERAQASRTRALLESLHRTGRVLVGEQKIPEALDQYERAMKIGESAGLPIDSMDGIARAYALILSRVGRPQESAAVERRLKEAIIRKADRDGTRRPKPVPAKR